MTGSVSTGAPEPRPGTRFPDEVSVSNTNKPFMPVRPLPCPDMLDAIAPELYDKVDPDQTPYRLWDIGHLRASHAELLAAAKNLVRDLNRWRTDQHHTIDVRMQIFAAAIARAEKRT